MSKRNVVLAQLVLGVALLVGATQNWVEVMLAPNAAAQQHVSISGMDGLPALLPTALALLALTLVLSIAGRLFRLLLAAGTLAASAWLGWITLDVLRADDAGLIRFAKSRLDELTGLMTEQHPELISSIAQSVWPVVVLVVTVMMMLLAAVTLFTSWKWRTGGRKYESQHAKRLPQEEDRIADWDALSGGKDPSDEEDAAQSNEDTPGGSPNGASTG